MQSYAFLFSGVPYTRLISYELFKKTEKGRVKDYILHLLEHCPNGLDTRQISEVSGIEIQCLTLPLKELREHGLIVSTSQHKSYKTGRSVMVYTLSKAN